MLFIVPEISWSFKFKTLLILVPLFQNVEESKMLGQSPCLNNSIRKSISLQSLHTEVCI
jgi:hypothetical protein